MVGRPSDYTQEIADEICTRIMESDYGLEHICDEDENLPSARTVFGWLAKNKAFREQYAGVREVQAEVQAFRGMKDALEAQDASLGRLKWDARRWAASKLYPKRWSDKLAVTGGDDTDNPIKTVTRIEIVAPDVNPSN